MENTIYYPTEQEFQQFLAETTTDHALVCAEYVEQVQEDVPAGDNLENQLQKLGLHLQAI
jgi:hypothetical protein